MSEDLKTFQRVGCESDGRHVDQVLRVRMARPSKTLNIQFHFRGFARNGETEVELAQFAGDQTHSGRCHFHPQEYSFYMAPWWMQQHRRENSENSDQQWSSHRRCRGSLDGGRRDARSRTTRPSSDESKNGDESGSEQVDDVGFGRSHTTHELTKINGLSAEESVATQKEN